MAWLKRSSRYTLLSVLLAVVLTLGFVITIPVTVQAQLSSESLSSKLPDQWEAIEQTRSGASGPTQTYGGGPRCSCIEEDRRSLTALVPASGIGATVAEYPTIFWYVPRSTASALEFVLRDGSNQKIYSVNYALAKEDGTSAYGLMSLTLPALAHLSPLETGQDYSWELVLICDLQDRSADLISEGRIKRIEPNPDLTLRIQQAAPQERVALYADARLWYETLATLTELRRDRPNDKNLANAWDKLLNSVGLSVISEEQAN